MVKRYWYGRTPIIRLSTRSMVLTKQRSEEPAADTSGRVSSPHLWNGIRIFSPNEAAVGGEFFLIMSGSEPGPGSINRPHLKVLRKMLLGVSVYNNQEVPNAHFPRKDEWGMAWMLRPSS